MSQAKTIKIQSLKSLREEMMAVARGERVAPVGAKAVSINSVEALIRLLTPENRKLLAMIRDEKPDSVAALAVLAGRAQSNLTRTLSKLEAVGLITMTAHGQKKAPKTRVKSIVLKIDPYATRDELRLA